MKILFFSNRMRAVYWYKYIVAVFPPALVVDNLRCILEINGVKYRFCSIIDEKMMRIGHHVNTEFYYDMDTKFEHNFENTLKEILL